MNVVIHIKPIRRHFGLMLICLAHLLLAILYAWCVPIFEKPDEFYHFAVVWHIANEWQLPVMSANADQLWMQEGAQPPLYYFVAAPILSALHIGQERDFLTRNPYFADERSFNWDKVGNNNRYLHPSEEAGENQKILVAACWLRGISTIFSLATVVAAYYIGKQLQPTKKSIALLAASMVAFTPQFIHTGSAISNDSLIAALAAWGLVVLLVIVQRGVTRGRVWLVSVLLALSALTKLSGLMLAIPIGLGILISTRFDLRLWRKWAQSAGIGSVVLGAITGWWYLRNIILYGDVTALSVHLGYRGGALVNRPTFLRLWQDEMPGVWFSFWAAFGNGEVLVEPWIYSLLTWLVVAASAGLVIFFIGQYRRHRGIFVWPLSGLLIVGVWVILIFASLFRWMQITPAALGRLLYPAIAALAVLMSVGLLNLLPERLKTVGALMVGLAMSAFAAASPLVYIAPAYARPPVLAATDMPATSHPLNVRYEDKVALRGYELDRTVVHPGETLQVTLYWEVLQPIERNYSVFVQLFGREREGIGQRDTYPGLGNFPTSQWQPGTVVADTIPVPISPEAKAPALIRIDAGLYELATLTRLPATDLAGKEVSNTVGIVKLVPWQWPEVKVVHPLAVTFGDGIRLAGYDLTADPSSATYHLQLVWQPSVRPSSDYTVFIQTWDEYKQVAGFDGLPLGGDYPTSLWEAGETIVDMHVLDWGRGGITSLLQPGRYRLLVGLYRLDTGERLPAVGPSGPLPDYAAELSDLWVR